jgi:adenine/guanine phosphoribosyltransferase-like PRPP-binding protein
MEEQKKKLQLVKEHIESYPDFPKPGTLFRWELGECFGLHSLYLKSVTISTIIYSMELSPYKYYALARDLFPVMRNPTAFHALRDLIIEHVSSQLIAKPEAVVALDARGFLFGPLVALHFDIPFIPIRKRGKLPGEVTQASYTLEYGVVSYSREVFIAFSCISHLGIT